MLLQESWQCLCVLAPVQMTTANSAILRITKELTWAEEVLAAMGAMRTGELGFHDRVFDNDMNVAVAATRQACAFLGCWPQLCVRLLNRACPILVLREAVHSCDTYMVWHGFLGDLLYILRHVCVHA